MDGKVCVVTGATSGIGKEIARGLALKNARLAIVCRNPVKGKATVGELRKCAPKAEIDLFEADVSALADVRRVADELHSRYPRVDVLVNNAGIHDPRPAVSAEGFDRMIATNHLGPFLLTNLLLDLLERGMPSRIVMIASESHRGVMWIDPLTFARPDAYGTVGSMAVYARSKMLNVLFAQEAAKRWRDRGVAANAVCPGMVATKLATDAPLIGRLFAAGAHTPFVHSPAEGALMPLRLASDPALEHRTGEFFSSTPGMSLLPSAFLRFNTRLQGAVWWRSEQLVALTA
ncbi:SDR family NAD(P)-dependent oxidoreductase [Streptomyces sp. ISL-11]|uniref:SDR family NAD(P)-dependent oxidoreductase n=1 Tax=Streptomyces sp. ISL-11 TaxID=2819174 RepID=UPI001BE7588E|nr:SDR family NAD(P)-dependent oxidoreductase [Streptomyces sp. ISL-11]MBT2385287.1 SDR family NAD(P)-dependent oxidoreductase [Streptomyces sp. ISL-11]